MADFVGNIEVPEIAASGTFPLVTRYPWSYTQEPGIVTHQIGNANANLKVEQRFYLGPGAKRFHVQARMNETERESLRTFWDARQGGYQPFTYNAPNPDGTTTAYTVRFASEPLSFEHLSASISQAGIWLVEVPDPDSAPTYSVSSTVTRFPSSGLATALLSEVQEIIPLIKIQPKESGYPAIYLSDRRVTIGTQLYVPRLLEWSDISQSIGGESDTASFVFGNSDRVMRDLANDTNLLRADIEFSLFHVGTTIKLDLWKGRVTDWSSDETNEFAITASDGLYELNLPYPTRKIDRRCWKKVADGTYCLATAGSTCMKVYRKNAGETGYDCTDLGQKTRFGGIAVKPQGVYIRNTGASGKPMFTATSIVNDSCYGKVLKEIYTDRDMPVNCEVAAGREENTFYCAMGIVGRGPIGAYATPAMVSTDDGGQRFAGHTLDGYPHHGFGTSTPSYGLRTSLGDESTLDNFSLAGEGDETAAGTAWVEIRRNDEKGIQVSKASEHEMQALVSAGLKGYTWTAPGSRNALATLTNPVWIAVNCVLRALGLFNSTAAIQEGVFDCAAAITAAGVCDQTVAKIVPADATTETQFKFIGVLGEQKPLRDWLQEILNNCCGYYVQSFGKLKLGIRFHSGTAEGGNFGEGNIVYGSLQLRPFQPSFNHLTAQFGNADYDWQTDSVTLYDVDHAALVGSVEPVYTQAQINLAGTCTKSQAARVVSVRLREELGGISSSEWEAARQISFRTTILSLPVEAGMVCELTHDEMPGGSGDFRVTKWRLNKDYSIDIVGRTTTDSMYDLTTGPKPSDVIPDDLPGERIIDTMPGDVTIISATATDDGVNQTIDFVYSPPGTDDTDIGTFVGVVTHIEAPDGSGIVQAGGEHDYDGDPAGVGVARYGTLRMILPLTVAEDRRYYLASKSGVYKKRLYLHTSDPSDYETPSEVVAAPDIGVSSAVAPADATLTSAVLLNRFAENGVQKQRIGILGTAPDPLGTFAGVHVWADIPDGGSEAKWYADGSVLADGSHYATKEREPLDLGRYTYSTDSPYLAIVVVDAPAATLTARFYAPSFATTVENPLHMVDEASPSPSVTLELTPNPAVISGEEYAPNASGFDVVLIDGKQAGYQLTNNVWEYWLQFSWTGVPSSNTRFQELTGYEIVFLYDDGSYGYSGWIDPAQTGWTSDTWPCPVTASFTAYLCSSGAGGRNTIVEGITPKIDIVINRPVDATAGQEYAPLVTGQYAALNKVAAADTTNGIEVYYFSFGWDAPTDDALADVHVWVYATADDRWIEIGQFDAQDNGEHATDRWPLDGNVSYTMYFYSRARDGRENTHSDTVTPKVTGLTATPAASGTIKGNRISTATLGTALGVESDLLKVKIAGPLYADISNNLNIQISSDFVVSGGVLTQSVIDLAKAVNFNTSEFTKVGGLLAVNTLAVNKLAAGDALFAGQATFACNGGGKLTINSSGLTVADHNTAPTCTLTLAASGITVAKAANSVQVTSSGVGIYGPSSQSVVITSAGVAISNGILTSATISGGLITGATVTINSGGITTTVNNVSDGSIYFGAQVADNSTGDCLRLYPRELALFDVGYKMARIGSDISDGHGFIELKDNSLMATVNISASGGVVSCREVRISSSTVIDLSRQIFATSFNPYVGGVQFYGTTAVQSFLTGCTMLNRLVRYSGGDLQYSNDNGENWYNVGSTGIDLGYTFVPTAKTIAVYGGACTSIG